MRLCSYKGVVTRKIDFVVEDIRGGGECLWDFCKHVSHVLIDAHVIRAVVDPVAILSEHGKL
jgi:hypothetical protein